MPLTFELHDEIEPLAEEWDDLVDRANASVFLRPGWFLPWRRAFGRGRLEIIAARDGSRLAGLAVLERTRTVLRSPTNWHSAPWAPLAEDAEALSALTRAMVDRARPWLSLEFLDAGGAAFEACRDAAESCRTKIYTLEQPPFVDLSGTWEEYEQRLSAKRRSNLRRLWRRLSEQGQLDFEVRDGAEDLEPLLEEGFKVEESGWKGEQGTAINSEPETRRFYQEVAAWAASRGALRLGFLRLDGKALAFDFAVEEAGAHALLPRRASRPSGGRPLRVSCCASACSNTASAAGSRRTSSSETQPSGRANGSTRPASSSLSTLSTGRRPGSPGG